MIASRYRGSCLCCIRAIGGSTCRRAGFGCGMTARRPARVAAGRRLGQCCSEVLLSDDERKGIEWEWLAIADSSHLQRRGTKTGPSPVTEPSRQQAAPPRRRRRHPARWTLTGGNRNDHNCSSARRSRRSRERPDPTIDRRSDSASTVATTTTSIAVSFGSVGIKPVIRSPPNQTRLSPGSARPPLGRRTHLRLAPSTDAACHPHRPPRRHPQLPRPRLLPHLLAGARRPLLS